MRGDWECVKPKATLSVAIHPTPFAGSEDGGMIDMLYQVSGYVLITIVIVISTVHTLSIFKGHKWRFGVSFCDALPN